MTRHLHDLTAAELSAAYRQRSLSPVEVTEAVLERAEALNPALNAFCHIDHDGARAAAAASEARWDAGAPLGPLDGVPVSVKNALAMAGVTVSRGWKALKDNPPPATDAAPVRRMRAQGLICFGSTTMPDLGGTGAGQSSAWGITRNPWNPDWNTGGSSSGCASALAAGIGPLSLGTDLGGSVRLPATFCGLSTIKPTQGVTSFLPPSTMRSTGPMARTVRDTAMFLTALAGPDVADCYSLPGDGVVYEDGLQADVRGWKIGILESMGGDDAVDPVITRALWEAAGLFEAAGAEIVRIPRILEVDYLDTLHTAFGAISLGAVQGATEAKLAQLLPAVLASIRRAEAMSLQDYAVAMTVLEKAKSDVIAATAPFDVVLAPTCKVVNFAAQDVGPDPESFLSAIHYTAMFNQTGQPAAVTCAGFSEIGLPFGLQFIGKRFDDRKVLSAAAWYEARRGFDISWPQPAV
ncbi:amidase [Frigidibacter sp. MR17.24]|uniref:amidase n=1 Tax=Frigidibacter sp. MR17.24 TaxID=3127345 RepID=UPI00301305FB